MKMRIEMDPSYEDEVIIRCNELNEEIIKLQQILTNYTSNSSQFVLYKGDTEYFMPVDSILFFETQDSVVLAHTKKDVYQTKYKLYELENILPSKFVRISKSSIVNAERIYSISRNLTASSAVEFEGTHKQIYVSRAYYKVLKCKLEEMRNVL